MANKKLTFEVSAKDVNVDQVRKKIQGIDKEILNLQQHAQNIRISEKGNTDIGKQIVESIENAVNELKGVKSQYENIIDGISNKKIDTKEFDNFVKEINAKFDSVEQRVSGLEESLTKITKLMNTKVSNKALQNRVDDLATSFNDLSSSIKPALEILKEFNDMVNISTNKPKEVKIKVNADDVKKIDDLYNKLNSDTLLGGKSGLKVNTATATKQLIELYDKYNDLSKQLGQTKDPKQITKLQVEMAELLPQMAQFANRIIELKKINVDDLFGGITGKISIGDISDFSKIFDFIDEQIGRTSTKIGSLRQEMRESLDESTEKATTEVSSFTFKNGGIRIPVTIDAKSKSALETKYNQIVKELQAYADLHPVNVTMRLFPLNTNRANAKEITNELRRIQTDINSVEDEGLKTKLNSLYDDLEAQFKKALDLKIKVDLGETESSVRGRIKDLQAAIKDEGFTLYPTFKISKTEAANIAAALKEIEKKATINIDDDIKKTTESITKMISGSSWEKWSQNFATTMDTVYEKLKIIQPYIETLANFLVSAKGIKNSIISDADVKNITALSTSIKSLKEAIEKVVDLDLSKSDAVNFTNKIQQGLNNVNPVKIPIEPNLSNINSFIDKIEDAINTTGLNIKISNAILPTSKDSLGNIVAQMMEADSLIHSKRGRDNLRERAFYYNSKTGNRTNPYIYDQKHSFGLKREILRLNPDKGYDTHIHTHPEDYASLSLAVKHKDTNSISGDILAFYQDFKQGIKKQIIAARKEVQIFNAEDFYKDYGNIFNDRNIGKKLLKKKQEEYNKYLKQTIEESPQSYDDIFGKNISAIVSKPEIYGNFRKVFKSNGNIIKEFLNNTNGNKTLSEYIFDRIKKEINIAENEVNNYKDFSEKLAEKLNTSRQDFLDNSGLNYQQILQKITPKILEGLGIKDFEKYTTRMSVDEFKKQYGDIPKASNETSSSTDKATESIKEEGRAAEEAAKLKEKFAEANKNVSSSANDTNSSTGKAAEGITEEGKAAEEGAKSKHELTEANAQLLSSIIESLKGLDNEGKAFESLNKLINNLGSEKGGEKLQKTVDGLKEIRDVLSQNLDENSLLSALVDLANKGTDLEKLATVLKATKKEITNAKEALKDTTQDNLKDIMESVDISGNAKNYLSQYGEVVNLTSKIKNGFIEITSTVLGADDVFKRYTLTTKNGVDMVISKQEENTTALTKEIILYGKLLKAAQNLNKVSPNQTDEVFIEKDSALWKDIIGYAEEYGTDLGNILSITRSVRQVNDELLESFKIVGENGSVTIGAENDVVASVQNLGNITKQLRQLETVKNSLQNISEDKSKGYTNNYLNQVRSMIALIEGADFNITNPDDLMRLEKMIKSATELKQAAKDTENIIGKTNSLERIRQKISDILNNYQAMPGALKEQFKDLRELSQHLIDTGATKKQVDEVSSQFLKLNADLSESGKKYQGMFAQIFQRLRNESSRILAQYFSFYDIIRYVRTAVSTVIDLDTQLVDLRKTTTMTTSELNEFYNSASNVAKGLGVTTSEIISQAAAWSRLGYSTKEASTQMAQLSSKFASVSPGMTTENSTDYLVSTMQAYGIEVDEVERKIMDNVNRIGKILPKHMVTYGAKLIA